VLDNMFIVWFVKIQLPHSAHVHSSTLLLAALNLAPTTSFGSASVGSNPEH